ncbi:hypothetical protein MXD60_20880, partial [Frankia sp. AgB32]|nr:hypothetical protein [Frankia sp. AgB32]
MSKSLDGAIYAFTGMRLPGARLPVMRSLADELDLGADEVTNSLATELEQIIRSVKASVGGTPGKQFVAQTSQFVVEDPKLLLQGGLLLKAAAALLRKQELQMDYTRKQGFVMFIFMQIQLAIAAIEAAFGAPEEAAARIIATRTLMQRVLSLSTAKTAAHILGMQMLFMPGSSLIAQAWQILEGRRGGFDAGELAHMVKYGLAATASSLLGLPGMKVFMGRADAWFRTIGIEAGAGNPVASMALGTAFSVVLEVGGGIFATGVVDGQWGLTSAADDAISGAVEGGSEAAAGHLGKGARKGGQAIGVLPPDVPTIADIPDPSTPEFGGDGPDDPGSGPDSASSAGPGGPAVGAAGGRTRPTPGDTTPGTIGDPPVITLGGPVVGQNGGGNVSFDADIEPPELNLEPPALDGPSFTSQDLPDLGAFAAPALDPNPVIDGFVVHDVDVRSDVDPPGDTRSVFSDESADSAYTDITDPADHGDVDAVPTPLVAGGPNPAASGQATPALQPAPIDSAKPISPPTRRPEPLPPAGSVPPAVPAPHITSPAAGNGSVPVNGPLPVDGPAPAHPSASVDGSAPAVPPGPAPVQAPPNGPVPPGRPAPVSGVPGAQQPAPLAPPAGPTSSPMPPQAVPPQAAAAAPAAPVSQPAGQPPASAPPQADGTPTPALTARTGDPSQASAAGSQGTVTPPAPALPQGPAPSRGARPARAPGAAPAAQAPPAP